MLEKFYQLGEKKNYWRQGERILLAISGGLDSMVLLSLMRAVAERKGFVIGVVHINHQLRPESEEEERYLTAYCHENDLPFYSEKWLEGQQTSGIEVRARAFRYDFFKSVMKEEDFDTLMTAHHMDDQAETILMRLTRGNILKNLSGIKDDQPFHSGRLIRPLLIFSKEELKAFAKQQNIVYFEDSSNHTDKYFRNRMRQQVIPLLKKENQRFLMHISSFGRQASLADELIQEVVDTKYGQWVRKLDHGWVLDGKALEQESRSFRYFFLQTFLQRTLVDKGIQLNQEQLDAVYGLLTQEAPQKRIMLEKGWQLIREYEQLFLIQPEQQEASEHSFRLQLGGGLFLSDTEWLGLFSSDQPLVFPEKISTWRQEKRVLSCETDLPLQIRHRKSGDRIALTPQLTKRLNRLFIDKKIPNISRDQAWVISSGGNEIIWVPGFANSYLSIPAETDKIHYILLYKIQE